MARPYDWTDDEKMLLSLIGLFLFGIVLGWFLTDSFEIDFLISKEKASADLEDVKFWYDLGFEEGSERSEMFVFSDPPDPNLEWVEYPKIEYIEIDHETGRLSYKMETEEKTATDFYCLEVKQEKQ